MTSFLQVGNFLHSSIAFILLIGIVIFVHELGHFLAARRFGVKVLTFSIGIGPKLYQKTDKHGTNFTLGALPLGGYIKMHGEALLPLEQTTLKPAPATKDSTSFKDQSLLAKSIIVGAGPLANFILAIVLLTGILLTQERFMVSTTIQAIVPGSAAEKAGLRAMDKIIAVDGKAVSDFMEIAQSVRSHPNIPLTMQLEHDITITLTPELVTIQDDYGHAHTIGKAGIHAFPAQKIEGIFWQAPWVATKQVMGMTGAMLQSLLDSFKTKDAAQEIGGVLRIAKYSGESAKQGIMPFFWLMMVISINLGLINLLPIPPLDGGHLLFYTIEAIFRKPLASKWQLLTIQIGVSIMLFLMLLATYNDIGYLWG
jgi:regulator of sigma E protease